MSRELSHARMKSDMVPTSLACATSRGVPKRTNTHETINALPPKQRRRCGVRQLGLQLECSVRAQEVCVPPAKAVVRKVVLQVPRNDLHYVQKQTNSNQYPIKNNITTPRPILSFAHSPPLYMIFHFPCVRYVAQTLLACRRIFRHGSLHMDSTTFITSNSRERGLPSHTL